MDSIRTQLIRSQLRSWLEREGISPERLAVLLGTSIQNVRLQLGLYPSSARRGVSRRFLDALRGLGYRGIGLEEIQLVYSENPLPPGTVVKAEARQCPICLLEAREGRRSVQDTWYVFGHPRRRYCSRKHQRRAAYLRRRQKPG
jgi:hypothetical protein